MAVEIKVTSIDITKHGGAAMGGGGRVQGAATVHVTISTIGPTLSGQEITLSLRMPFDELSDLVPAVRTALQTFAKELDEAAVLLQV